MSNIYVSEPPTSGKVVLETTVGDIEIELWSKEAPKACRNFVQLCMEGYFNNTIFHRMVPGWIVQGGDPSGTGEGGESIYDTPFVDEFHSRLRFSRRGLVGMANSGPNDNRSQFFITLAPTPELQKKNTLFATVVGDSLYNALKLGEGEVDKETERPVYPRKIVTTRVLDSPFTNITVRSNMATTAADTVGSVGANTTKTRKKKAKTVKNKKLLSFADDEDDGDLVVAADRSTMKSSHDLLVSDPSLGNALLDRGDDAWQNTDITSEQGKSTETDGSGKSGANKRDTSRPGSNAVASNVDLMRAQYKSARSVSKRLKNDSHEDELLARLGRFKSKIRKVGAEEGEQSSI